MNSPMSIHPRRRITRLEAPAATMRWDVAAMLMLLLLGLLDRHAPR